MDNSFSLVLSRAVVGVQNQSPQEVPLCYADYFELEATNSVGSREPSALLNYLEKPELRALPIMSVGEDLF